MEYCVDYLKKARKHLDDAVDIFNTIENDLGHCLKSYKMLGEMQALHTPE